MIKVLRIFPRFFKDKVKKIIKNLTHYFKKKITLKDLAKLFKLTGIHIDFYGIESIYQSIYSFYKKKKNSS